jgi:hypothetical protein
MCPKNVSVDLSAQFLARGGVVARTAVMLAVAMDQRRSNCMRLCLDSATGTRYRRLRHYASSRKVAGSIPDAVIGFLNWPNPSSRIMVLGSTQLLTEMSSRNLPGGKEQSVRKAVNLTAICEPIVYKMWEPLRFTTLRASMACYRDSFTCTTISVNMAAVRSWIVTSRSTSATGRRPQWYCRVLGFCRSK